MGEGVKKTAVLAIVGGGSLLGREVREVLEDQGLPLAVKLIGLDEDKRTLIAQGDEAVVMTELDEENLRSSRIALLAGSQESSRKALAMARRLAPSPVLIDLTYAAEDDAAARLRAPVVEVSEPESSQQAIHVIAHPAAITVALLLGGLNRLQPIRRSIAHVFEPASERGRPGLEELQRQTVGLLSFQTLPKETFDAQLSFNMLSRYGVDAPETLESVELRIERHLASLLERAGPVPMPSLRLIQAPVFHGYSVSLHVEFEKKPDLTALAASLASPLIDVRDADVEPPTNVGIAGQGGIAVGSIAADRNNPLACWFWAVADNFRLMAEATLAVVRSVIGEKS